MRKVIIAVAVVSSLISMPVLTLAADISNSTTETEWGGLSDERRLSEPDKRLLLGTRLATTRAQSSRGEVAALGEAITRAQMELRFLPFKSDVMARVGISSQEFFAAMLSRVQSEVVELALRSPNRGAIALSAGSTIGYSLKFEVGGTSSSRGVTTTTTTCDDNLKWKGYQINCQTGMGPGSVDGVTYEFIAWTPIKAEGVAGPVRWRYQGGNYTVTHIAKGTEVTFNITGAGIKVVAADNLVSFKRDGMTGNAMDSTSQNMTRSYVDLLWRDVVSATSRQGEFLKGEWIAGWGYLNSGPSLMQDFVRALGNEPVWAKDSLEAMANLTPDDQAAVLSGSGLAEHGRLYDFSSGGNRPYDPESAFKDDGRLVARPVAPKTFKRR